LRQAKWLRSCAARCKLAKKSTALGGAGMTLSFGLDADAWRRISASSSLPAYA
jgi:hypothetical protein